jgi:hypothetical protein
VEAGLPVPLLAGEQERVVVVGRGARPHLAEHVVRVVGDHIAVAVRHVRRRAQAVVQETWADLNELVRMARRQLPIDFGPEGVGVLHPEQQMSAWKHEGGE